MDVTIGHIPGYPVGTLFASRMDARPVHPYTQQGIHGDAGHGAGSIVLSGGYPEDEDHGDWIIYTGEGQNRDQTLDDRGNRGLVKSCVDGLPVRVIRGAGGEKTHSPAFGYRYDGLMAVEGFWSEPGTDGYLKWRFRMSEVGDFTTTTNPAAKPTSGPPTPPTGASGPAAIKASVIQRRVRSTAVTQWVKELYRHRCQICDQVLELPAGQLYSEGCHIRPLGHPHNGPDLAGNVLCLCPSDHVRLDRGALVIEDDLSLWDVIGNAPAGSLTVSVHHAIDVAQVTFHRRLFRP